MPETITKNVDNTQIIAGVFSSRQNADKAIDAFRDAGVPEENIQVVIQLTEDQAKDASKDALVGRGFAESQALFYEKAVENGKFLVAVHNVTDPAKIIEIFDANKAESNPDGSRNVRQDVVGLTVGAAVGAVAGGVVGTAFGGPVGGVAGAAAGAVIGGAGGGAAGKVSEHRK
jgi:hypothetical protein